MCPHCGSTDTRARSYGYVDHANYIRVWRGRRYIVLKCSGYGRDFYIKEPPQGIDEQAISDNRIVEDEDELHTAEEELRSEVENENDRRYKPS